MNKQQLETAESGFVDDEAEDLALLDVVEADDADVAVGIFGATGLYLVQDFAHVSGAEQRQLPHRPVVFCGFRGLVEFDCRNVTLIDDVLDLLGNLGVGQGGQVR